MSHKSLPQLAKQPVVLPLETEPEENGNLCTEKSSLEADLGWDDPGRGPKWGEWDEIVRNMRKGTTATVPKSETTSLSLGEGTQL